MRTALDAATPVIHASLGDNLAFERKLDVGAVDAAFADSDEVAEVEFRVRPAHRRDAGAARGGRGLECRRGTAHDLSGHAGAAHGAEHRRAASGPPGGAGSRGLQGCRRLLRHQGAHLCRRDGDLRAVEAACGGRSSSSPTGSRASIPIFMPATIAARAGSASSATAPSRRSRSTISPASVLTRCIRAPARSKPIRSSISSAGPTRRRTIAPAPASCSRIKT